MSKEHNKKAEKKNEKKIQKFLDSLQEVVVATDAHNKAKLLEKKYAGEDTEEIRSVTEGTKYGIYVAVQRLSDACKELGMHEIPQYMIRNFTDIMCTHNYEELQKYLVNKTVVEGGEISPKEIKEAVKKLPDDIL